MLCREKKSSHSRSGMAVIAACGQQFPPILSTTSHHPKDCNPHSSPRYWTWGSCIYYWAFGLAERLLNVKLESDLTISVWPVSIKIVRIGSDKADTHCSVHAAGIYVEDILGAVPINKFFELFKPRTTTSAEGGMIKVSIEFEDHAARPRGTAPICSTIQVFASCMRLTTTTDPASPAICVSESLEEQGLLTVLR